MRIDYVAADDWMGIYLDDKLLYQGNNLSPIKLLRLLAAKKVTVSEFNLWEVDYDWWYKETQMPYHFYDVVAYEEFQE